MTEFEQLAKEYGLSISQREILEDALKTTIRADERRVVASNRPKIVCLCGSTRFGEAFREANLRETLAGNIVLSIGCDTKNDDALFGTGEFQQYSHSQLKDLKKRLDALHKRKIDLADEVLILNVGGYIGESTRSELEYARTHNKAVRFLEPTKMATK